jgi:hypothetical protein
VIAFLESTRHKPHKLPPVTAFNNLSAVRKIPQEWRSSSHGFHGQFTKHPQHKGRDENRLRVETGITVKDTVRLPVSMDMIQGHHAAVQREIYTAINLAVYTAQVLAFTTLSRVSEYLYTGESGAHTLVSERTYNLKCATER